MLIRLADELAAPCEVFTSCRVGEQSVMSDAHQSGRQDVEQEAAEKLVESGTADYISLCRPLVREPGLVRRWKEGDRRPSDCISDNACGWAATKGGGVRCVHLG